MGDYSVPKEIRDLRPRGSIVKKQGNGYYAYQRSSTKVKVLQEDGTYKWKTKDTMGPCLGTITLENGFVPNSVKEEDITILEYGNYVFSRLQSLSAYKDLEAVFGEKRATQIYAAGLIAFNEGFTCLKDMSRKYSESAMCKYYPNISFDSDAMAELYEYLGQNSALIDEFEQRVILSSSHVVGIDRHAIASNSARNDLSEYGYSHSKPGSEQLSWICAHDLDNDRLLASQFINGQGSDCTSLQQFLSRFDFSNAHFYVGREFNTVEDKLLMSKDDSVYTVPMIPGTPEYKSVISKLWFNKQRCFTYDRDGSLDVIYYQELPGEWDVRYIAFKDTARENEERQAYCEMIKKGIKGFTDAGRRSSEKEFGLLLFETTENCTAEEVFCRYRGRGAETYCSYAGNMPDFSAFYPGDDCKTQGVEFVVQVAARIFSEIKAGLAEKNETVRNVMDELSGIKAMKDRGRWLLGNVTKSRKTFAEKLGVSTTQVDWPK